MICPKYVSHRAKITQHCMYILVKHIVCSYLLFLISFSFHFLSLIICFTGFAL